ncbi:MAG: PEP-CTERM sorting domain-containing protein [Pirellulales bacterium]|nr:PEP-CTERM sorting domain-containing protein [Pirellulales bacterium]
MIVLLFVFLLCTCTASSAAAGIVKVDWEGQITAVDNTHVPLSVQPGLSMSGTLFFDSNGAGQSIGAFLTRYDFPTQPWTLDLPGQAPFARTGVRVEVSNDTPIGLDAVTFATIGQLDGDFGVTIALRDFDATLFSDQSLPTKIDQPIFNQFEFEQLTISRRVGNTIFGNVITGQFTSFTVRPVPEPTSLAVFGVLATGTVFIRRKKR